MKYLVTWHDSASNVKVCNCRYFHYKEPAMQLYNDFKKLPIFDDVQILAVSEKPKTTIEVTKISY